jgi:hypothetical protein
MGIRDARAGKIDLREMLRFPQATDSLPGGLGLGAVILIGHVLCILDIVRSQRNDN